MPTLATTSIKSLVCSPNARANRLCLDAWLTGNMIMPCLVKIFIRPLMASLMVELLVSLSPVTSNGKCSTWLSIANPDIISFQVFVPLFVCFCYCHVEFIYLITNINLCV